MKQPEIVQFIAENIRYKDWEFLVNSKNGVMYLQVRFDAADNISGRVERQHCRKWQLSEWMTPTEIVQTCWAAIERAELHEAAEHFKYKGADIFNTHVDVEALVEVCQDGRYEHRGDPVTPQPPEVKVSDPV